MLIIVNCALQRAKERKGLADEINGYDNKIYKLTQLLPIYSKEPIDDKLISDQLKKDKAKTEGDLKEASDNLTILQSDIERLEKDTS